MKCPNCNSDKILKHGKSYLIKIGIYNQKYKCEDCGEIFSAKARGRPTVLTSKKCKGCNTLFKPRGKQQIFCSKKCYKEYRKTHKKTEPARTKWKICFCNYCKAVYGKCIAQNTKGLSIVKCDSLEHPTVEEFIEKHRLNPKDTLTIEEITKVLKGFYFFNETIPIKTATKQNVLWKKRASV